MFNALVTAYLNEKALCITLLYYKTISLYFADFASIAIVFVANIGWVEVMMTYVYCLRRLNRHLMA